MTNALIESEKQHVLLGDCYIEANLLVQCQPSSWSCGICPYWLCQRLWWSFGLSLFASLLQVPQDCSESTPALDRLVLLWQQGDDPVCWCFTQVADLISNSDNLGWLWSVLSNHWNCEGPERPSVS
jgi:hypothetical protein